MVLYYHVRNRTEVGSEIVSKLTTDQWEMIARAVDLNNSDVDLCEFQGKTVITYSWGNQKGTEFLAEAVYDGTLASFLKGLFP